MNNPESNFMSPLHAAGQRQPLKKQRGGATPTANRSLGSTTPADDAIARRRAELRRLQAERTSRSRTVSASASASAATATATATSTARTSRASLPQQQQLLDKAKSSLTPRTSAAPPPPASLERVRHSDLFPTVTKGPPGSKPPLVAGVSLAPPSSSISSLGLQAASGGAATNSTTKKQTGGPPPAAPAPVNRRLEFSAQQQSAAARSKSAPPRRPPPPPPKPAAGANEAPPTTMRAAHLARNSNSRPEPVTATPLLGTTAAAAAAATPQKPTALDNKPTTTSTSTATTNTPATKTTSDPSPMAVATATASPTLQTDTAAASTTAPPTDMKTPKANTVDDDDDDHEPPSTARRDRMNQWRQHLSANQSTANARLEHAFKDAEAGKNKALQQVTALEKKLLAANTPAKQPLQQVLQMADSQGEQAALKWARDQCAAAAGASSATNHQVGFLSPMAGIPPGSPMMFQSPLPETPVRRRRISQRTLTPHPKNAQHPLELERQHIIHFRDAASCIPFEYASEFGNFVVRRPYGMETADKMFQFCKGMPLQEYRRKAHISDLTTLEVAVEITADQSLLLLHGTAGIRYFNKNGNKKDIPNVDELDRPLGTISYIDAQANEKDYSLDEILEQALLVREQYCSTMMSTAMGLKDRPPPSAPTDEVPNSPPPGVQPSTSDVGIGTDPTEFPPESLNVPSTSKDAAAKTKGSALITPEDVTAKKGKTTQEDHRSSSGDVLAIFLGIIFKGLFGVIHWFFIALPVKIVTTSLIAFGSFCVLGMTYLYLLEDHNLTVLNGTGQASLYYTNAPGVL